jgi:hypothetical protein
MKIRGKRTLGQTANTVAVPSQERPRRKGTILGENRRNDGILR